MATVEDRVPHSTAAITVAACAAAAVAGTEAREPRCWDRPQHCERVKPARELKQRQSALLCWWGGDAWAHFGLPSAPIWLQNNDSYSIFCEEFDSGAENTHFSTKPMSFSSFEIFLSNVNFHILWKFILTIFNCNRMVRMRPHNKFSVCYGSQFFVNTQKPFDWIQFIHAPVVFRL